MGVDADSRLVTTWLAGDRSTASTIKFFRALRPRLWNRVELTTNGYMGYREAVNAIFGPHVDYAMLVKDYDQQVDQWSKWITG